MRIPLAPAGDRAGGFISAGIISTVQTPLPILALIVPKVCPAFCAPSPESLTISTICSSIRTGTLVASLFSTICNSEGLLIDLS
ncbi:hypothetical protein THIOM_000525 [Candidatus Thiomargarita nelsonii]|uniref:Uncharacterized protein n=1 Tax=Candidatus Thiomargarita nelsonii TaxID=1003181 RepID=A0A176S6W4_9GAMM|nr:hypothetical protein THIOM_000525 [Candidatus Thiomargarita nelsonii]